MTRGDFVSDFLRMLNEIRASLRNPLFHRLGDVVWNMGQTTVEPEHKPEQRRGTDGNGDSARLALRFRGLGCLRTSGQNKTASRPCGAKGWPLSKDGFIVADGRSGNWLFAY
jgi:hypothetical protein